MKPRQHGPWVAALAVALHACGGGSSTPAPSEIRDLTAVTLLRGLPPADPLLSIARASIDHGRLVALRSANDVLLDLRGDVELAQSVEPASVAEARPPEGPIVFFVLVFDDHSEAWDISSRFEGRRFLVQLDVRISDDAGLRGGWAVELEF